MTQSRSGGCQCGALRYRAESLKSNSHVCHCRMCQKATGSFFAPLIGVPLTDFTWTRGKPTLFMSSEQVERGFCNQCGTPMFYRHTEGSHISMMIGTFDNPQAIPLAYQVGTEARLPQVAQLAEVEDVGTTEGNDAAGSAAIKKSNRQHPDRDTTSWPA